VHDHAQHDSTIVMTRAVGFRPASRTPTGIVKRRSSIPTSTSRRTHIGIALEAISAVTERILSANEHSKSLVSCDEGPFEIRQRVMTIGLTAFWARSVLAREKNVVRRSINRIEPSAMGCR